MLHPQSKAQSLTPIPIFPLISQGFQEIVDLNAVNVAMDGKSAQRATAWADKLHYVINAKGGERYTMVRGYSHHVVCVCMFIVLHNLGFKWRVLHVTLCPLGFHSRSWRSIWCIILSPR